MLCTGSVLCALWPAALVGWHPVILLAGDTASAHQLCVDEEEIRCGSWPGPVSRGFTFLSMDRTAGTTEASPAPCYSMPTSPNAAVTNGNAYAEMSAEERREQLKRSILQYMPNSLADARTAPRLGPDQLAALGELVSDVTIQSSSTAAA